MRKRVLSALLALCMLVPMFPVGTFAAEEDDAGPCQHHPEHTEDCGYIPASEGAPCSHAHGEDCYALVEDCVHVHDEGCYGDGALPTEDEEKEADACEHVCTGESDCLTLLESCVHIHEESCYGDGALPTEDEEKVADACEHVCTGESGCLTPSENCVHIHDESCYSDGVLPTEDAEPEADACVHVCTEESGCLTRVLACPHTHDEECGYVEAVEGHDCMFVDACSYVVLDWVWADENGILLPGAEYGFADSDWLLAAPGLDTDDLRELLPDNIIASMKDGKALSLPITWDLDDPEDYAWSFREQFTALFGEELPDIVVYTAELPEGFTLGEDVPAPTVLAQDVQIELMADAPAAAAQADEALHFIIRHWHAEWDSSSDYNDEDTAKSGDRYFVVAEGYIVPQGGKYKFYVVSQKGADGNDGSVEEIAPGVYGKEMVPGEFDKADTGSSYVATNGLNADSGTIILKDSLAKDEDGNPAELFSTFAISAGHDAVTYAPGGNTLTIKYNPKVRLVKGHALYRSKGEIRDGTDDATVFGNGTVSTNSEQDTAYVYVDAKGNIVKNDDGTLYNDKTNPPAGAKWTKVYSTAVGLHTDKTARLNTTRKFAPKLNENGEVVKDPETGKPVMTQDNRTFDLELEAWYTEGDAPHVAMVLDASGSMGFASDVPTPINVNKVIDELEKDGKTGEAAALRAKIGAEFTREVGYPGGMLGYYEIQQNSREFNNDKTYRTWYLNTVKGGDPTKYWDTYETGDEKHFAKLVEHGDDQDAIDFSFDKQKTIINGNSYNDNAWGAGGVPVNFSADLGLNLTNKKDGTAANSAFLLDVTPDDSKNFTISFSLQQYTEGTCASYIEILYIGAETGNKSDSNYFHVIRRNNDIVVTMGQSTPVATISDAFTGKETHTISFVFGATGVTTYWDGIAQGGPVQIVGLSAKAIAFSPFPDNNTQSEYFWLDNIYLYNTALNVTEINDLVALAGKALGEKYSVENFLNPGGLALLMDPHNTDNSKLGNAGYSYFVYDARANTAEYTPLGYYTAGVPGAQTDVNGDGWYYSSYDSWSNFTNAGYTTAKSLRGIPASTTAIPITFYDTITSGENSADMGKGAAPDVGTGKKFGFNPEDGNSGQEYKSTNASPVKFYIDRQGYLRCFFSTGGNNPYTSYVYELDDKGYVKTESLQRAIGDFVTRLSESSRQSTVSAVKFSGDTTDTGKLVLLNWTNNPAVSANMLDPEKDGNKYALTGGTYTKAGLNAFIEKLQDSVANEKGEKYLIIFTDGADNYVQDLNGSDDAKKPAAKKGVEDTQALAEQLKRDGYTIFTVLLNGGPVQEGAAQYQAAHEFLRSLSGTSATKTDDAKEAYFFSVSKGKEQLGDAAKGMNDADILTQIFSDEILDKIVKPLDSYTVQDYIDPRFDLVTGLGAKVVDTVSSATHYVPSANDDYILRLNAGGQIDIVEMVGTDAVTRATVNLQAITENKENTDATSSATVPNNASIQIKAKNGGITAKKASSLYVDYTDKNGQTKRVFVVNQDGTLNVDYLIKKIPEKIDGKPNPDPDKGKLYLSIHLGNASTTEGRYAGLFYDSDKDMYYIKWMDQTISACTIGESELNIWRAVVTVRAKDDFIGGNAVLTNGNTADENYVYNNNADTRSSGTREATKKTEGDGFVSKGFPRVAVNVPIQTGDAQKQVDLYMGEEIGVEAVKNIIHAMKETYKDGPMYYYWEYLERYAAYYNSCTPAERAKLELPKKGGTAISPGTDGKLNIEDLYKAIVSKDGLQLPYYYLPDDYRSDLENHNWTGTDAHRSDKMGYLIYESYVVLDGEKKPYEDKVTDKVDQGSIQLDVTFKPDLTDAREESNDSLITEDAYERGKGKDSKAPEGMEMEKDQPVFKDPHNWGTVSGWIILRLKITQDTLEKLAEAVRDGAITSQQIAINISVDLTRTYEDGTENEKVTDEAIGTFARTYTIDLGGIRKMSLARAAAEDTKTDYTLDELLKLSKEQGGAVYLDVPIGVTLPEGLKLGTYTLTAAPITFNKDVAKLFKVGDLAPIEFSETMMEQLQKWFGEAPEKVSDNVIEGLLGDYQAQVRGGNQVILGAPVDGGKYTDARFAALELELRPYYGNLEITKAIKGDAPKSTTNGLTYTFTITGPADADGAYDLKDSTDKVHFTKGTATGVTITGPGSVTILRLPLGDYTVTENKGGGAADIKVDSDTYKWSVSGSGGTVTVKDGETVEVAVTNTYKKDPKPGELTIEKELDGDIPDGAGTKTYTFTISTDLAGVKGQTYPWKNENGTKTGSITFTGEAAPYTAEVTVTGQSSVTISGLPAGTYSVVENETAAAITGYELSVTTSGSASVEQEQNATVTVTNTYTKLPGGLTVSKEVKAQNSELSPANKAQDFTFQVTLIGTDASTINGTYGDMTFTRGVATFTLKHGEHKTAENLPDGIGYTVTEIKIPKGYTLKDSNGNDVVGDGSKQGTVASGTIETGDTVEVTAVNTYTLAPTAAGPQVTKALQGRALKDGEFSFEMSIAAADGSPTDGWTAPTNMTATNNGSGANNVQFSDITFTKPGTYIVTVKETQGSLGGVGYDAHEVTITYKVKDNGDGTLVMETGYPQTEGNTTFTNTYTTKPAKAIPTVTKTLTGATLNDVNEFEFTISTDDTTGGITLPTTKTAKNDGKGEVAFGEITFTKPGTYTVTIMEKVDGVDEKDVKDGILYDTHSATITYKVKDDGNGQLVMEDGYPQETGTTFINQALGDLTVSKTVVVEEGNNSIALQTDDRNEDFTFTVTLYDLPKGATLAGSYSYTGGRTDADATAPANGSLTFTKQTDGTYKSNTFTLKHGQSITLKGLPAGAKYTVEESGYGSAYKPTSTDETGTIKYNDTVTAAFTNTRAAKGSLTVSKTVTGKDGKKDKDFDFTVTLEGLTVEAAEGLHYGFAFDATDNEVIPITDQSKLVITWGSKDGKTVGTFTLRHGESVTITGIPAGVKYTVAEADYTGEGYSTDASGTGGTDTSVIEDSKTAHATFINQNPMLGTLSLTVNKKVSGQPRPDGTEATFTFTLRADTNNPEGAKLPQDVKITIAASSVDANGTGKFDDITFSKTGTYTFYVTETAVEGNGYTMDSTEYTIVVNVISKDGDNSFLVEKTTISSKKANGTASSASGNTLNFTNVYAPEPVKLPIPVEKKVTKPADYTKPLPNPVFTFTLEKGRWDHEDGVKMTNTTATTTGAGSASFADIEFTRAGTYTFTVKETAGSVSGFGYDTASWTVTVVVEDKGGQLAVTSKTYSKGSMQSDTGVTFENTYSPPIQVTLEAEKIYLNDAKDSAGKNIPRSLTGDEFTFELTGKSVNGRNATPPMPADASGGTATAKNDETGKIRFDITFTDPGTYTYELREVTGGDDGDIEYDNTVYTVVVEVEKQADGTLKETIKYHKGTNTSGDTVTKPTFTNYFKTPQLTIEKLQRQNYFGSFDSKALNVKGGDTITYQITVTNPASSTSTAYGVTVTDVIPEGLTLGDITDSRITPETKYPEPGKEEITIIGSLGDLAPGQSGTITFDVKVPTTCETATQWTNVGQATYYDTPRTRGTANHGIALLAAPDPNGGAYTIESKAVQAVTGALKVSKIVSAPDTSGEFEFTVKFTGDNAPGTVYYYKDLDGELENSDTLTADDNGEFTFTLTHKQSIVFTSLAPGMGYTLKETKTNGLSPAWKSTSKNNTINGSADGNSEPGVKTLENATTEVTCTNAPGGGGGPTGGPGSATGSLTVTKTVTGSAGETDRAFRFTVTIGDKTYEFTLKDGETWTLENITAGTGYTVTELDAGADGYTTTAVNATGTIPANGTATAEFVNHKDDEPTPPPDEPDPDPVDPDPVDPDPDNPDPGPVKPSDDVPKTGDNSHLGLWTALMILSALGMLGICFFSSRKRTLFSFSGGHKRK